MLSYVFTLIPSFQCTLILFLPAIVAIFAVCIASLVVAKKYSLLIALRVVMIVLFITTLIYSRMYIQLYYSKVIIEDGTIEVYISDLFPLRKQIPRNVILKAYVARVNTCLQSYGTKLYGVLASEFAIGVFKLHNGDEVYVASTDPYGVNLVLQLRDKTYLVLRPNNFKYFLEIFSKEVMTINITHVRCL